MIRPGRTLFRLFLLALITCALLFVYIRHHSRQTGLTTEISVATTSQDINLDSKSRSSNQTENRNLSIGSGSISQIGSATDLPDVTLDSSGQLTIFGRVLDEDNQPIENALISYEQTRISTRTNSKGEYELTVALSEYKYPVLHFLRSGYESRRVGATSLPAGKHDRVELNVTLGNSYSTTSFNGWVRNQQGEGLNKQTLRLSSRGNENFENLFYYATSDSFGEFNFEGIKSGINYQLDALLSESYLMATSNISVSRNTPPITIIMGNLHRVDTSGLITSIDNTPLSGFEITVQNISTLHSEKLVTDSSGYFDLDNFPEGAVLFTTKSPEYIEVRGITLSRDNYQNLVIPVDSGIFRISGWVRDSSGLAVVDARVSIKSVYSVDQIESFANRTTITDQNGYFLFDGLADLQHEIVVYARDFGKQELTHKFISISEELSIILLPK